MSRTIAIVTDSTSDLTPELQEQHGITVVPLNVHFGQETYRDAVDLSATEFMDKLATTEQLPTTSQPAVGVFEEVFRSLAPTHDAIVCILISAKLSGTVQSATLAAEAVADTIPVHIVDSNNAAFALGLQAIRAAALADAGRTVDDVVATLNIECSRYHTILFVETLEHLRRGGRIGKAAQMVGSILQLRPLLRVEEGQVVPFERTRTRSKAIDSLVRFTRDLAAIEEAAVMYNTTEEDAYRLATQIAEVAHKGTVPVIQLGPVISTHVGPGVLGVVLKEATGG